MANEKRLIDANALRQNIERKIYWGQVNNVAVLETIDEAPTVDAVEVVRCKDLSHQWCYDNMKSWGFAMDGRCNGLAGGTKATNYLSEDCCDCPYLTLTDRKKEG